MNNFLKLVFCCAGLAVTAPVLAKAPINRVVAPSEQVKRQRAIEESIGRIQLDHLIAGIVDGDEKRPAASQRASRVTTNPVG